MDADRIYEIAGICHEMNRRWCELNGDTSQPAWGTAPEWQTKSVVKGVQGVLKGATPAQSHFAWVEEKKADGWVYGKKKDAEAKTHPCMMAYSALPPLQKAKDSIFIAVVEGCR